MAADCRNVPLEQEKYAQYRRALIESLAVPANKRRPYSPLDAYSLLFNERLDSNIQWRITMLYTQLAHTESEYVRTGHVYVFRDARDPPDVVKIGSTRQRVERRLNQWRRDLNADAETIYLLFAYRTPAASFAEDVLHALLACAWLPNRYNARTGARLVEYFQIGDLDALRYLCQAVTRHVAYTMHRLN